MPLTGNIVRFYVISPSPNDGDMFLDLEVPIIAAAGVNQPTDAELIDLGNRLVASDYVQNQTWGATAELVSIEVPASRTVYP